MRLLHSSFYIFSSALALCAPANTPDAPLPASDAATVLLSRLDLEKPGLEKVKAASENPEAAARELLDYYRARTSVKHPADKSLKKSSLGNYASAADIKTANDALKHIFVGQPSYPPHFCGDDIDWGTRPVPDNEWVWQLNRMTFWSSMARAYWHTGDEKYAREWVFQFADWVKKTPPDKEHHYAWRSIEAGIRGLHWTHLFMHFIDSPSVTPEFLVTFLNSCYEHAHYLMNKYSAKSNWALMEAEGMAFIAITFPEFKDAEKWRTEAISRLNREIDNQVYPDGHQRELSIGYHIGCVSWFSQTLELAKMNGMEDAFPESYRSKIEKMCEVPMKLGLPDGSNTQFGDSWKGKPGANWSRLKQWAADYNRPDFLYAATGGGEGKTPGETAFALKESGLYSMRSGWTKNDICLVLKCGPDGGGHCQPDNGTFELYAGGRHLMPDSGCYIYSGDPENRAWFRQTKVHQTLTLDGKNTAYAPKLLLWKPGENLDVLVVENASYPALAHRRAVFFIDKAWFVIVDETHGTAEGDVDIHFQLTPGKAQFDYKNLTAQTTFKDGWNVLVKNILPKNSKMEEEEGRVSFVYTKKEPRPAFRYRVPKTAAETGIRFVTIVAPHAKDPPAVEVELLGNPGIGASALNLKITTNGKSRQIGYNLTDDTKKISFDRFNVERPDSTRARVTAASSGDNFKRFCFHLERLTPGATTPPGFYTNRQGFTYFNASAEKGKNTNNFTLDHPANESKKPVSGKLVKLKNQAGKISVPLAPENGRLFKIDQITLFEHGKTNYHIVLPDAPTAVEQTAAKELKSHLDEITGADWPMLPEKDVPPDTPQILVGNPARAKILFPAFDAAALPRDGIVIQTSGSNLLLAGHPRRGALYAVYTFLEEQLGVRWWSSTEKTIPKKTTITIPKLDIAYNPKLTWRQAFYKDALDPVFATRLKSNGGGFNPIPPEYGGHEGMVFFAHSFHQLIPPEKYFDKHPEWFSEINGKRAREHAQLCLANEEMRMELTKNALHALRAHPDARYISISQNDDSGWCACPACAQITREEESQAGPLIRFVNAVAADIEKEFPDTRVETLAYQSTRKPPKLAKPRKNVLVRLCTNACYFVRPLTAKENEAFARDIEGWSRIAHELFIWDYVTNFDSYMQPHPNLRVLGPNIRFFVNHRATGLFEHGDSWCAAGDFVRMRAWVLSRLLWNPEADTTQLTREFLTGYYGAIAAPFLEQYLDCLLDRAAQTGELISYKKWTSAEWLDFDTLSKATELFNTAILKTEKTFGKQSDFARRLRRDKLPLDHIWLIRHAGAKRTAAVTGKPFLGPPDPLAAAREFVDSCKAHNVRAHREFETPQMFDEYCAALVRQCAPPAPPPAFVKDKPEGTWSDCQEFHFKCINAPHWVALVDDDAASNKRAAKMPGNHRQWSVQMPVSALVMPGFKMDSPEKKYRILAHVRCVASTDAGEALFAGVHDEIARKTIVRKTMHVADIAGSDYKWVEIGVVPLREKMYLWFAPPGRAEVEAVFIDRIIIESEI